MYGESVLLPLTLQLFSYSPLAMYSEQLYLEKRVNICLWKHSLEYAFKIEQIFLEMKNFSVNLLPVDVFVTCASPGTQ